MNNIRTTLKILSLLLRNPSLVRSLLTLRAITAFLRAVIAPNFDVNITLRQLESLATNSDLVDDIFDLEAPAVVIFPVVDWSFRFQRPHHIATGLVEAGFRVIYISPVSPRSCGKDKFNIYAQPLPELVVVSLTTRRARIRNLHCDLISEQEITDVAFAYGQLSKKLNLSKAAIICQHPYWTPILAEIEHGKLLYDRLDDHGSFPGVSRDLLVQQENRLFGLADVVVATSHRLFRSIPNNASKVLIRNASPRSLINTVTEKDCNSVIYVGAIEEWFDVELVQKIAEKRPKVIFHLVGSVSIEGANVLGNLPNCFFYGELPYADAMKKLARSSVGIIPFHINELTLSTNPVKLYEYLSFGLPVVATPLPELEGLEYIDVYTAGSPENFMEALDHALARADSPAQKKKRKEWIGENTWEKRIETLRPFLY